jgi:ribosomal protein L13E
MSEKKSLKSWNQDRIIRAVAAVREKQVGFKKAQKMLNVPKISVKRCVNMKEKHPEKAVLTKLGRSFVFSKDME